MKRLSCSDSIGDLMSLSANTADENSPRNVYSREFQSMLDGLDEDVESGHVTEKKRRLSVDQVKALEKNFEVENKLEPERKIKLAQELGLQPRQVAVWFQNRRARWKTKQLERDYGVLKANYDSLKLNYDSLQRDNEALSFQIRELKSKLNDENTESNNICVKEEIIVPVTDDHETKIEQGEEEEEEEEEEATEETLLLTTSSFENYKNNGSGGVQNSSDSDSSAILNEDTSPNRAISSTGEPKTSSSPSSCLQFAKTYQTQFIKLEEHNFFSGEEACNFFSDEQAPSLQWYCPDQWNCQI